MSRSHPRRAIERALALGVGTGALDVQGGARRGNAKLYVRVANIHSVTATAHPLDVHSATKSAHSVSAPYDRGTGEPTSAIFPELLRVRQCAVTPFAVTQGERSSFPLQETNDLHRHTRVTGSGALGETC